MEQLHIGELVATRGIVREMEETFGFREFCMKCVMRHRDHDWGDLPEEDKESNMWALHNEARILSSYKIPKEFNLGYADKIWIITEADRRTTTILYPDEY